MPRTTLPQVARAVATMERLLADAETGPERRERLETRVGLYRAILEASSACRRCGRHLIDPQSVAAGIGPECVKKDAAA